MDASQFAKIARALADPQRFALLERIASADEVACKDLVRDCSITQATISHHMKGLGAAGLVDSRREGKCCHFKLNAAAFRAYQRELTRRIPTGKGAGAAARGA